MRLADQQRTQIDTTLGWLEALREGFCACGEASSQGELADKASRIIASDTGLFVMAELAAPSRPASALNVLAASGISAEVAASLARECQRTLTSGNPANGENPSRSIIAPLHAIPDLKPFCGVAVPVYYGGHLAGILIFGRSVAALDETERRFFETFAEAIRQRWIALLSATEKLLSDATLQELMNATCQVLWRAQPLSATGSIECHWSGDGRGFSPPELSDFGWLDWIFPADRERCLTGWLRANETRTPLRLSCRVFGKDGEFYHVQVCGVPVLNQDGTLREWIGSIRDITQEKATERALRNSERQFRATFEKAAMGIAHVSLMGRWLRVNERLCEITGYSAEELMEKTFQDITHPADLDRDLSFFRQLLDGEIDSYSIEKRYIRKQGGVVWINLTVTLLREADGTPECCISLVEDISARKAAVAALAESERRFRELADAAPIMIWLSDANKHCTYFNAKWLEFRGHSIEQEYGEGWLSGLHPDDRECYFANYSQAFDERRSIRAEYRLRNADGEYRWVLDTAVPRIDRDGEFLGYVGAAFDITDIKENQQALIQARLAAESSDRAKECFLSALRHELYTPANPLLAAFNTLLGMENLPEGAQVLVERVRDRMKVVARLIDQLLDMSAIDRGKLRLSSEPVPIFEVIREAVQATESAASAKKQEVVLRVGGGRLAVEGDRTRLRDVFVQVLENAIKFTGVDGHIAVETSVTDSGRRLLIKVSDDGRGIEPEAMSSIFEPFNNYGRGRAADLYGGLGLGLWMAKKVVELHGGTITAGSRGRFLGATFSVELPLTR